MTWALAIETRAKLAYPALRKIYSLIARNSRLKNEIKITPYIRSIITYRHQLWAAAAKIHINKTQKIQNKLLRIILNKSRDTLIPILHKMAKIRTINEFIQDSVI